MKDPGQRLLALGHPLHLVLGLSVWAVWFTVLYGGQAVGCAVAAPEVARGPWTWINGSLLLLTLATAALLGFAAWSTLRGAAQRQGDKESVKRERFMATSAGVLYFTAAVSTLLVGVPLLLLPPCV